MTWTEECEEQINEAIESILLGLDNADIRDLTGLINTCMLQQDD